jgi:MoaA/NifB/PqqE/SkfB family radical SAM enzyme
MLLNLSSLAPDSFVFGDPKLLEQFYPKKIVEIPSICKCSGDKCMCNDLGNPWGAEIHLTSKCQLNCSHCSYGNRNKEQAELDSKTVDRLLSALTKLRVGSIIFSGGGDPLAWTEGDFDAVFKTNAPYTQAIATNTIGINRINKDILQRLDIIQVNVNGYDRKSFLQNTNTDIFTKFLENVTWIFENRSAQKPQLTGKVIIDNNNFKDVIKYLEFCNDVGFDLVVIKLAGNFEAGQNVALSLEQKRIVRDLIHSSAIISKYPAYLDAISTENNAIEIGMPEKCWVVENGLYILIRASGDVFPCVASPYTCENRLGNIYENDLEEIWGNIRHGEVKNKLHNDMRSGKCNLKVCRHMRYNYILDESRRATDYVKSLPKTDKKEPDLL